jgi:putative membrane protein
MKRVSFNQNAASYAQTSGTGNILRMTGTFLFILGMVTLLSCNSRNNANNNTSTSDTTYLDNNNNNAGTSTMNNDTWDQDKIKEFVDEVSLGGLKEVQLGKLAQKKALSTQVRDYGKTMAKDHGDANDKLKPILQALGYNAPTTLDKDHQDVMDKFNKLADNDFDKEYMSDMVSDHKDDIDKFEKAQKNLPAGELKTWVDNTLPVLRNHLQQAESIKDQIK